MRSGLVLIELMLAMVITALIAAFAIPHIAGWADAAAVREETLRLVAAVDAARGAAMRLGATSTLTLSDTAYRVTVIVATDTIVAWRAPGSGLGSVVLSGAGAAVEFGPDGLATGAANRTFVLGRGSVTATVVMSRLGRVTY